MQTLCGITGCIEKQSSLSVGHGDYQNSTKYPYLSALWHQNKHGEPLVLLPRQ